MVSPQAAILARYVDGLQKKNSNAYRHNIVNYYYRSSILLISLFRDGKLSAIDIKLLFKILQIATASLINLQSLS